MNNYIIYTDSGCDIKPSVLKEWGVAYSSLTFRFEDEDKEYTGDAMESSVFYNKMKEGGIAKTSAINPDGFTSVWEAYLKQGTDILYLGFSSGLSTTYNSGRIAAQELNAAYPERKIITVDSLAASAGQGLLLYLMVQKKNAGATMEEVAAYAEEMKPKICHWFTVDDLVYLKRGGRVSPTVAFVGNMLGIKPVLHVDNEGHLVNVAKARGRKAAVAMLADKFGELGDAPEQNTLFISHGACPEDVENLKTQLKTKYGADVNLVTDVGPVIGAHTGPGVLAFFFIGKER